MPTQVRYVLETYIICLDSWSFKHGTNEEIYVQALDDFHGTVRKRVDDAGPSRVVEYAAEDLCIDPIVAPTLKQVQKGPLTVLLNSRVCKD